MLIHCSALYGVPDGLEERFVPLVHHDRKLRLPRVVESLATPQHVPGPPIPQRERHPSPSTRPATYSPGNPGFPASCPGFQSAGSSSSSETSESTRTVREAQLAAEDFLQPLGGDRCIDPGRAWISVAQDVLNVFEGHTAVREGDADGMAESVEGQRSCNTRGLQVATEDPLGRDVVQAPCSATHDRNEYKP